MHKIAQGGMGAVFKAVEPALERYVAIKVLRPEFAQKEEYIQFFQEEARAVAALRHANIVPIYYIGRENKIAYFSMAYIEGQTLDDWIEANRHFTPQDATWFMTQAVAALEAASQANIVHLDIKPSNFLVDSNNVIMLTDFGLAQRLGGLAEGEREAFGTPAYVSPEQITREKTDQRTDIYSLGASLFHLMVGKPPFDGDTAEETVWGHLQKPFPFDKAQEAGVPLGWTCLMQKMMERSPRDRFQNYAELREAMSYIDGFRYEAAHPVVGEISDAPKSIVSPRHNYNARLLHGLLRERSADWAEGSDNAAQKYSRNQVLDALKKPLQPLSLDIIVHTIDELCHPAEGDIDDLLSAMQKLPGLRPSLLNVAKFLAGADAANVATDEEVLETLGMTRARNLALVSFMLNYETKPAALFDWRPLWQHQASCGLMMEFIYDSLDLKRSGIEFALGVFHDIGKLVLAELFPYTYLGALIMSWKEQLPLVDCEMEFFGIDHAEMGEYWLKFNKISHLSEAVGLHERPVDIKRRNLPAHALYASNYLIKQLGAGYSGNALTDPSPWAELPSVQYLWESARRRDYDWEAFSLGFPDEFPNFPEITLSNH